MKAVVTMKMLKSKEKYLLILIDIILVNLSYVSAMYFRFDSSIPSHYKTMYKNSAIIISIIYVLIYYIFRLYKSLWSYASIDEFFYAVSACIIANIVSILALKLISIRLPNSVSIMAGIICILFTIGFRMSFRIFRRIYRKINNINTNTKKIMIVGAGVAGNLIVKEMRQDKIMKYEPVAFIDDDIYKTGKLVSGVKVCGTRKDIVKAAKENDIDTILIAIPSIKPRAKKELLDICKETGCDVKVMPNLEEIINNKVTLNTIRDVNMEDLLGRDSVKLDTEEINKYINNKVVMITGGGGSIGSELCRQIVKFKPTKVIVLDEYENNAYELQQEFRRNKVNVKVDYVIASIRDEKRLDNIFHKYRPQIVFHAAAHKHVPLMEDNPSEAIKNNVFGTLNLARCSNKYNVQRFVMISTDKAVNPTNIMGATKRVCEMIIQSMDKISKTQFVAVRFGNVLGSNGSVVPLFIKQIKNGGPVTVTHREINRFFMTIPEAAQLVLQAAAFAKGGEIFVLDMDKPVKIYDLACDLIKLFGYIPNEDIEIKIVGLRPGEKLYEEVLTDEEGLNKTGHDKIFVGKPTYEDFELLNKKIDEFREIIEEDEDEEKLIEKLEELVPTYNRFVSEEVAVSGLE